MSKRVCVDCRKFPSEKNCSLYVAGTLDEVLDVAVSHAVKSHGHADTPALREQIRGIVADEVATR